MNICTRLCFSFCYIYQDKVLEEMFFLPSKTIIFVNVFHLSKYLRDYFLPFLIKQNLPRPLMYAQDILVFEKNLDGPSLTLNSV